MGGRRRRREQKLTLLADFSKAERSRPLEINVVRVCQGTEIVEFVITKGLV